MKIFTLILSIYLMVLNLAPCTDTHDEREDKIWGETSHNHEHEDDCPPLCACNCCGVVMTYHYIDFGFKEPIKPFKIILKNDFIGNNFIASYYHNIWQPPRF